MSVPPPQNNSIPTYFESAGKKAGNFGGHLVALLQGKTSLAGKEPLPKVSHVHTSVLLVFCSFGVAPAGSITFLVITPSVRRQWCGM
jgi:hypothetical protein